MNNILSLFKKIQSDIKINFQSDKTHAPILLYSSLVWNILFNYKEADNLQIIFYRKQTTNVGGDW